MSGIPEPLPDAPEQEPPVHAAARLGDLARLEGLLREGHDVNQRADYGEDQGPHLCGLTPLMAAARSIDGASAETLRWLLAHGADLHARSQGGHTAAWYAAGQGGRWSLHRWRLLPDHVERLRFLLEAGLDARETCGVGRSLLVEACRAGDPARVRLLLERGAVAVPPFDPAAAARSHEGLIQHFAGEMSKMGIDESRLRENLPPFTRTPAAHSAFALPIFCAAESGSAACVRLLLEAGAPADTRDDCGRTPLMRAASREVAEILLDAGADPDARSGFGEDVLTAMLQDHGCEDGTCDVAWFDAARAVLARRPDLLAKPGSSFGGSRLYSAAFGRHADTVDFLLSIGMRPDPEPERDGQTPLHAICWQGEMGYPEPNEACERIIRSLVRAGADVQARDDGGYTPMHEAAYGDWGSATAVRVLLELGAEADSVNRRGVTPLMLAADRGERACLELLLAAGADPTRCDDDGWCAVHWAEAHHASWITIVRAPPDLPSYGASPEEVTRRHQETLAEATACLDLLKSAAIERGWRPRPLPPRADAEG